MGLFKRIKDLLDANISDLISKAEDPEKMLNLYVERATQELKEFNIQVNRAVADELMLRQKIEASEKEMESWTAQARVAVQQGRDDLARIALERKQTAQNNLESYQTQLADQEKAVAELRENYRLLEEKLNKAKAEREQLIIRQRRAKAMKQANEAVKEVSEGSAMADFDRMRDKVMRTEAEAQASRVAVSSSLEDEFDQLKKSAGQQNVDDELARLKAELGKEQQ
ncbi:PspA/IM30 family protein [Desulfotomaculum copahuensis]|uniref:Phage shock protein A n=1 Tax=Desulfotomaculum copahuensis TaxID=1838280 RepID=A0A1B7LDA1_9FIRM|nr:PspA/IM30 family protein [Desulfotomaculum copahuensis]OAT80855.1 phage shock protein A [Desulfotomaculum copahuensis]